MQKFILLTALLTLTAGCAGQPHVDEKVAADPKVVLIIGDGMDDQQVTIGRNYLVGNNGRLVLDGMPYRGAVQVQTVAENDPGIPVYVGDSASGATAMASGIVTSIGRIGTTAKTDLDVPNIMELARSQGFGTGIVTTARVTDASPASFFAHISNRYCQAPGDMVKVDEVIPQDSTDCTHDYQANGGPGSIAEQLANSELDIVLGGGLSDFEGLIEGSASTTVLDAARANGFTVVRDRTELEEPAGADKLLGLFSAGNMPVQLRGANGGEARFVERDEGKVVWPEPFGCEANPAFSAVPSLAEMTRAALNHFDSEAGFMLMIESSSIDKEAHYWRPCGHIGEVGQLNDALQLALDYAEVHPETLILVTADHGQAAQLIPQVSELAPQNFAPTGRFARVVTQEGGIMGIGYATNDSPHWEEHSGVQVPLYASGPGGLDDLPKFMRQADVFHIAATHLGLSDSWPGK